MKLFKFTMLSSGPKKSSRSGPKAVLPADTRNARTWSKPERSGSWYGRKRGILAIAKRVNGITLSIPNRTKKRSIGSDGLAKLINGPRSARNIFIGGENITSTARVRLAILHHTVF